MGEVADMMLDGTMCEGCGEFLHGEAAGHPNYCSERCARDRGADWWLEMNGYDPAAAPLRQPRKRRRPKGTRDTPCPVCGKMFRGQEGMENHRRMKHAGNAA